MKSKQYLGVIFMADRFSKARLDMKKVLLHFMVNQTEAKYQTR